MHPLPAYQVGGKLLLDAEEIDAWIKAFPQAGAQLDDIVEEVLNDLNPRNKQERKSRNGRY
jgi:ribosomal protein S16